MQQPVDYSTEFANPMQSFGQGYSMVRRIEEDQRAQQERADAEAGEKAAEARARSLLDAGAPAAQWQRAALEDPRNAKWFEGGLQVAAAQEKAQAQQREQQETYADMSALFDDPKADIVDYQKLMARRPALRDQLSKAWESVDKATQQQRIAVLTPAVAAAQNGNIPLAYSTLKRMEQTYSGTPEGEGYRVWADMAKNAPDQFRSHAHLMLSAAPGAKEAVESAAKAGEEYRKSNEASAELAGKAATARKARAEATTAEAKAAHAPELVQAELDESRAKRDATILDAEHKAGMLAVAKEGNTIEREKMMASLDAATQKKAEAAAEKVAAGAEVVDAFDSVQRAIDDVLVSPAIDSGSLKKRLSMNLPWDSDTQVMADRIETLKSRLFFIGSEKMRGLGSMTQLEGGKIADAVAVLKATGDPTELRRALAEVGEIALRGRANAVKKFGLESAGAAGREAAEGVSYGKTAGGVAISEKMIAQVMKSQGATREEVMRALQQQ